MCPVAECVDHAIDLRSHRLRAVDPADARRAAVTVPPASADRPAIELGVWIKHVRFERTRDLAVRNELFDHYAPYARNLAASMYRHGEASREELEQVAYEALLRALDRFETDRRLPFEAYARATILGTLKRHYRDQGWAVRVPRRVHELAGPTRDITERLTHKLARVPLLDEVAEAVGTTADEIREAQTAMARRSTVAMDAPLADDEAGDDRWSRLGSCDAEYGAVENRLALAEAVDHLTEEDRQLLTWYFEEGLTQTQIGERLGTSQMQVSRLLRSVIRRLRVHVCD